MNFSHQLSQELENVHQLPKARLFHSCWWKLSVPHLHTTYQAHGSVSDQNCIAYKSCQLKSNFNQQLTNPKFGIPMHWKGKRWVVGEWKTGFLLQEPDGHKSIQDFSRILWALTSSYWLQPPSSTLEPALQPQYGSVQHLNPWWQPWLPCEVNLPQFAAKKHLTTNRNHHHNHHSSPYFKTLKPLTLRCINSCYQHKQSLGCLSSSTNLLPITKDHPHKLSSQS